MNNYVFNVIIQQKRICIGVSEMALENRTLLVLKYLWENTDEEHTATIADLREFIVNSGL